MTRGDVRPRLISAVLADPKLSYRDKCYLLTVASVTAEQEDGKRRKASSPMNERGVFTLHVDYIANSMGRSRTAVREARESLEERGWLSRVHEGTHGRPATYQALVAGQSRAPLRVQIFYTLTNSENPHPYETEAPRQGCGKPTPLPIRRPTTLTPAHPTRPTANLW